MPTIDATAAPLLERQFGLIARSQAVDLGFTRRQVDYRISTGEWLPVETGVYRHRLVAQSWSSAVLAPCLAFDAVASHRCAASLWGLDGYGRVKPEWLVPAGTSKPRPGARLHETNQWSLIGVVSRDGIPTTGIGRTLMDLGAVTGYERLRQAIDDARRRQLIDEKELVANFLRLARRGRDGSASMRRFVDHELGPSAVPRSMWSRWVKALFERRSLPKTVMEYAVEVEGGPTFCLDLAIPRLRIGIELDSIAWHLTPEKLREDAHRRNLLENAGWTIRSFTWKDTTETPDRVVSVMRGAIEQAEITALTHRSCG